MSLEPVVTISLTEYERLKRVETMKMGRALSVGYRYEIKEDDNAAMLWGCTHNVENKFYLISQQGIVNKRLTIEIKLLNNNSKILSNTILKQSIKTIYHVTIFKRGI